MGTLRQLEIFAAVAEYKKMSEAAKRLYISQPTVSQIISDLETEYGVELFERHAKELKITPAGETLLNSAKEIMAINEQLEQTMHNIKSKRQLRIGATLTIGNTIISPLVSRLLQDYPDIDVTVFIDNTKIIEQRILHNELDIALVEGVIVHKEILTEPILDDYLCIICSMNHPFAKMDSISLEDLQHKAFIMREKGSGTRSMFENLMQAHHISYVTKWECNSGIAIIDAVRHNLGLGFLSKRCCQNYIEKEELHECPVNEISMKRSFYVCYNHKHPLTSQMKDFITTSKNLEHNNHICSK